MVKVGSCSLSIQTLLDLGLAINVKQGFQAFRCSDGAIRSLLRSTCCFGANHMESSHNLYPVDR